MGDVEPTGEEELNYITAKDSQPGLNSDAMSKRSYKSSADARAGCVDAQLVVTCPIR